MKYGKNQWARISSLLTRKTPKQCKARWFEWLDPSIKKAEWSKDEDEKLLHMAKLMPTQWRTIAPIVGRTPAQCLERYQKLLDEAELGDEAGPTSDDVRKLRPGEIDPDPESKPARPDPVDMDEDEKEMLSEARARLANTQGKKAKRKAREKQLAESRRISNLQKRRELKNAGIEVKQKRKGRGMDYNADIPFHKPQPAGFYDTSSETKREFEEKRDLSNALLEQLEGKRRMDIEEDERKRDFKKIKSKKDAGDDAPSQGSVKNVIDPNLVTQRRSLILPAPQVTEADLEDIVKMGVSGESARSMIEGGNETPASGFVGQYSAMNAPIASRTPRVLSESGGDALKAMARNLKAMTESSNPLLGKEIEIEGTVDFGVGATPKAPIIAATPRLFHGGTSGATPRDAMGITGKTPARDVMGINTPQVSASFDDTPQRQPSRFQQHLSSLFAALPKPKNDFEIVVPDDEEEGQDGEQGSVSVEDNEMVAARKEAERVAAYEKELSMRSQVIRKSLPRPTLSLESLSAMYGGVDDDLCDDVDALIQREKGVLLYNDATLYPHQDQEPLPDNLYSMEKLDAYLDIAADLIRRELAALDLEKESIDEFPLYGIDYDFDVTANTPLEVSKMGNVQYKAQHKLLLETMKSVALTAQKQEKRVQILLGGYEMRRKALLKTHKESLALVDGLRNDYSVFCELAERERELIQVRLDDESRELQRVSLIEMDLQDKFRELSHGKSDELMNR